MAVEYISKIDRVRRGKIDHEASQVTDVNNYKYAAYALVLFSWTIYIIETAVLSPSFYFSRGHRIFVATWNVAGKSPPSYLNLEDWLQTSPPADIYVLGYAQLIKTFFFSSLICLNSVNVSITEEASFIPLAFRFQEIVPLNAGNVLGTENNGPARKWLALIRKTLNSLPGTSGGCHTPSPTPDRKMWVFILSFKTREKMVGENFDEKTRRFSSLPSGMQGRYGFPM